MLAFLALMPVPILLLAACATATRPETKSASVRGAIFEQELRQACGESLVYPINARCIRVMGSIGPLLRHRSDLVMKIWRSCPYESPCYRVASKAPACAVVVTSAHPLLLDGENQACLKREQADYSCAALLNDPVYTETVRQPRMPDSANFDCERAKAALSRFDGEIENMALRIRWYQLFAAQGF